MADSLDAILKTIKDEEDAKAQEAAKKYQAKLGAAAVPPSVAPDEVLGQLSAQLNPLTMDKNVRTASRQVASDPKEVEKALALVNTNPDFRKRLEQLASDEKMHEAQLPLMINTQTDLSPFMAFAGQMSDKPNNALLQAYQGMRPQSSGENIKLIEGLKSLINKQRGDLSDDQREYLKEMLSGKVATQDIDQVGTGKPASQAGQNSIDREFRKDVISVQKSIEDKAGQFDIMDEAIASNDFQKINQIKSIYARVISGEKGVLTEPDVVRIVPKNFAGDAAAFMAYFNSTPTADMPPEYVKAMKEMITVSRNAYRRVAERRIDTYRDQYLAAGASPSAVKFAAIGKKSVENIAPNMNKKELTPEEREKRGRAVLEEIERRKAARENGR